MTASDLDPLAGRIGPPSLRAVSDPREDDLSLLHHFSRLTDPRTSHTCRHQLTDVLLIALCAVLAGADTWDDIALFGRAGAYYLAGGK